MQGPVFGFNVSGASEWSDKLVHQVAIGPDLITGGAYGEGSVVVIAFRFVVLALVILATHRVTKFATTSLRSPRQKATAELQEQSKMWGAVRYVPLLPRLGISGEQDAEPRLRRSTNTGVCIEELVS